MITVSNVRHAFPEPAGMTLQRKNGYEKGYTFLHFFNSVKLLVGGEIIETAPHSVIIYDKNTPQYFYSEKPLVHDWMHFFGDVEDILKASGLQTDKIYSPQNNAFITNIVREIETEYFSQKPQKDRLTDLKVQELFLKLGRSNVGNSGVYVPKATAQKFRLLREKMFSSLNEKWTVERMAKEVGFSQSRFFYLYKTVYGISSLSDLIRARTERAKNLLSAGGESVEMIAENLGYQNTTHFIRQFKSVAGISPSAYAKSQRH